jgi:cytochrome c biogenesis protein CcmG/thiol:disulfide interchange protein DsbE
MMFLATIAPVAALVALLSWGVAHSEGNPGGLLTNSEPGEQTVAARQAPAFAVTPLDGGPMLDNESVRGKVVLLDFWSSWCAPCRAEAADLARVYLEYVDAPVEFVGVAIWDQTGDVLSHLSRFNVTYPNALDDRGHMAVDFGVRGIPEKFFLDAQGNIVRQYIGPMAPEALRAILNEMLSAPQ